MPEVTTNELEREKIREDSRIEKRGKRKWKIPLTLTELKPSLELKIDRQREKNMPKWKQRRTKDTLKWRKGKRRA